MNKKVFASFCVALLIWMGLSFGIKSVNAESLSVTFEKLERIEQYDLYYGASYYIGVPYPTISGGTPPYKSTCTLFRNGTKVKNLYGNSEHWIITEKSVSEIGVYTISLTVVDDANNQVTTLNKGHIRVTTSGSYSICDSCPSCKSPNSVTDAMVEASCTETGLTEGSHCAECNATIKAQTIIPAKGHSYHTISAVEATCTESGLTEGKYCDVCGVTLVEQKVVKAKGHLEVPILAVEPTCTKTGLTEGKKCSRCNTILVEQGVIAAKGHTEAIEEAVLPTCTKAGLTEGKYCSVCYEIIVAQISIPATGHTEVIDEAVLPTCTETGLSEGKHCSICNEITVKQKKVPATGHTETIDVAVEPSCTQTGLTEGKHCSVCNEIIVKQKKVPATGHTEAIDAAVEPSCTQTGLTKGKHCCVCNEIIIAQSIIPALGHSEIIDVAVAPTYTTTGLTEGRHCSRCGAVLVAQEVIPVLPPPPVPTIILSNTDLSIKGIQTKTITASLSDESDYIASVKSDKKKVAKVKFSGNTISVTSAKQAGKAAITVTTAKGATAQINVTVKEGVALNEKKVSLKKDKTFKIKVLAIPSKVKATAFKSDKPTVATVDGKGTVKAVGKGSATITVTLSNKKTLKLKVTVK